MVSGLLLRHRGAWTSPFASVGPVSMSMKEERGLAPDNNNNCSSNSHTLLHAIKWLRLLRTWALEPEAWVQIPTLPLTRMRSGISYKCSE